VAALGSFAVLHMQKMKMSDVKGIQIEAQRESKNLKNPDIDFEKSGKNYDLFNPKKTNFSEKISDRIAKLHLKKAVRKDATVDCSFIVSASPEYLKSMDKAEIKRYFETAASFFSDRYGQENMINAIVHLDEPGSPHLHLGMVPVTSDGRLSAKDLFDRKGLQDLQTDFAEYMQQSGFDLQRGTMGSHKKHLDEITFKISERQKELDKVSSKVAGLTAECGKLEQRKIVLVKETDALTGRLEALNGKCDDLIRRLPPDPDEKEMQIIERYEKSDPIDKKGDVEYVKIPRWILDRMLERFKGIRRVKQAVEEQAKEIKKSVLDALHRNEAAVGHDSGHVQHRDDHSL